VKRRLLLAVSFLVFFSGEAIAALGAQKELGIRQ
jgi:hypothetical protein